jgi:hypothetical protein
MKKLLLSIAALLFATLLFSLGDSKANKEVSKDNPIVVVNKIDLAS